MKKPNTNSKYNAYMKFDGTYWLGCLWKDGKKHMDVTRSIHKDDVISRLKHAHKRDLEVTEWEEIQL